MLIGTAFVHPSGSQQIRILLAETDASLQSAIKVALQEQGYQVQTASSGLEVVERCSGVSSETPINIPLFDLVILEWLLPGMNGLEVCRHIRQQGSSVPVLMLSTRGNEADVVVGLEAGADDYLRKPFSLSELVARCRALLRGRIPEQTQVTTPVLMYKEIALYPQEHRVTLRGEPIDLSPKEFSLLEVFLRSPNRVFTREQLLDRVWGLNHVGTTKTVDVHIRWLREKIEDNPSNPQCLITVRGFGYRLA